MPYDYQIHSLLVCKDCVFGMVSDAWYPHYLSPFEQQHDVSTQGENFFSLLLPKEVLAKSAGVNAPTVSASTTEPSGLDYIAAADPASETDFDLNEGFPTDDDNQDEPVPVATVSVSFTVIHQPSPVPFSVPTISSGILVSITVAAAAKYITTARCPQHLCSIYTSTCLLEIACLYIPCYFCSLICIILPSLLKLCLYI
jgi:hypothetical protein